MRTHEDGLAALSLGVCVIAPGLAGGARFGVRQLAAALAGPACRPHTGVGWLMAASKLTEEKRQLAAALQSCTPDGRLCSSSGFVLTAWPFMVAYLCDGQGAKKSGSGCGTELETNPSARRWEGQGAKRLFLYERSHQPIENKGRTLKNEPKTALKRTQIGG